MTSGDDVMSGQRACERSPKNMATVKRRCMPAPNKMILKFGDENESVEKAKELASVD